MCESCLPPEAHREPVALRLGSPALSRRDFLNHSAMAVVGASAFTANKSRHGRRQTDVRTVDIGGGVTIFGRDAWGADHPPTKVMTAERPEDVEFLLVHHTVSSNSYRREDVAGMIRGFYSFHSGQEKKWADVAYNFLIDRFGRVWEARAGSIDRPMKGAATGGSQGHAMLCSFIGDHMNEAPSSEAQNAMVYLLAWLADKYTISTAPGATASFVSRGSNRHPEGATVVTPTIQGHRGMSLTSCPGDACYSLVENEFPVRVETIRSARVPATSSTTTTTEVTTTTTSAVPTTTIESTTSSAPASTALPSTTSTTSAESTSSSTSTTTTAIESTSLSTSTTEAAATTTSPASVSTATSVPSTTVPPDSSTTVQAGPASTSTSSAISTTTADQAEVAIGASEEPVGGGGIRTLGAVGGSVVVLGALTGGVIARRRKLATETAPEPGARNEVL